MDFETDALTDLGNGNYPLYSKDGERVVLTRWIERDRASPPGTPMSQYLHQVLVMNADGTGVRQVAIVEINEDKALAQMQMPRILIEIESI